MMAENKNKVTELSVDEYLLKIEDSHKRDDGFELLEMMEEITGMKAQLWGNYIIGFGSYHYKYESGHEGDSPFAGFAVRQQNFMVSFMDGFDDYREELKQLGKYSLGDISLYFKRLDDIDIPTLRAMIEKAFKLAVEEYGV
jgi:hypothetical protein